MSIQTFDVVDGPLAGQFITTGHREFYFSKSTPLYDARLTDRPVHESSVLYRPYKFTQTVVAEVECVPRERFAAYDIGDVEWLRHFGLTEWHHARIGLIGEVMATREPTRVDPSWAFTKFFVMETISEPRRFTLPIRPREQRIYVRCRDVHSRYRFKWPQAD